MRVVAIVGSQGSGKTTLIERLIPALRARGLTVSTIKHTHHHHIELDVPGKDSHRHRVAGAAEVIVASDTGWARIAASPEPASLQVLLGQLRAVDAGSARAAGAALLDGRAAVASVGAQLALAA
jgi:molybdopterin-guanine dinucleotide biosynthesis protein B